MPLWDSNQLDDQPTWDASVDFRGGMNSTVLPHLLKPTEFVLGNNTILTNAGRLQTRGGTEVKGDLAVAADVRGLLYFDTPTPQTEVIVFADSEVKVWDNSTLAAVSGTNAYDLTGEVAAFQALEQVYFCGSTKLFQYDGANIFKVTRLTVEVLFGGTSGYSVGDALTFTGGASTTPAVGEVASVLAGVITGITLTDRGTGWTSAPTVTCTTGSNDATFTVALVDPPTGTLAAWHTNRAFLAGDSANPTTLRVSDILDPAYWALANSIDVGSDGEAITCLFSWDVFNLLVFKAQSVYLIPTNPADTVANWQVQKISSTVGCVAARTAVQVGTDVWWLSREGVMSVRRLNQETQREITDSISAPIQELIDRITWGSVETAVAVFYDNKYILSLPVDGSVTPNVTLVYDTYHQTWSGTWDGFNITAGVVSRFLNESELYLGTPDGELRLYNPETERDQDGVVFTDISTTVNLRAFMFSDPVSPKSLLNVELEFQDSTATLDVKLSVDGEPDVNIALGIATGNALLMLGIATLPATITSGGHYRRAFNLLEHRKVRDAQLKLTTTAGRLAIRSAVMSAFVETIQLEQ